jgi:hypothetical protein
VPVRFLPVAELPRGVSQKVSRTDLVALFDHSPASPAWRRVPPGRSE